MEKRLFVGIKIKPSKKLLQVYQEIKSDLKEENIKWSSNENLHITLKFLGNTNLTLIPQIKEEIEKTIAPFQPFLLGIKGVGIFKKNNDVKVIWLGIDKKEELNSLASQLIKKLEKLGFINTENEYKAHLTLGRANSKPSNAVIQILLDKYSNCSIQNEMIKEIILFESVSATNETIYLPIESFSLKKEF